MNRVAVRIGKDRERGAIAVVVALMMGLLLASAALGVDIAKLAYERQALRAAVDAGAQAGSYALPDAAAAVRDAKDFVLASAPDLNLKRGGASPVVGVGPTDQVNVSLFCTVAVKAGTNSPDESQVPSTCNPGSAWSRGQAATGCNGAVCLLPCAMTGSSCNTIQVSYAKTVDFMFGPAIGIPAGSTSSRSASCKGTCGATIPPNPMDVVVMADRTPSMRTSGDSWLNSMKTGITGMLADMNEKQQYVAFGAIHKSESSGTCATGVAPDGSYLYEGSFADDVAAGTQADDLKVFGGSWVPVSFTDSYNVESGTPGVLLPDPASNIYKAVNCMPYSTQQLKKPVLKDGNPTTVSTGTNTHLAAAMKGAARYLLGKVPNNLATLPDRSEYGTPKKVILFETDGQPVEVINSGASALSLDNPYDIGAAGDGEKGCANLKTMAGLAKDKDILIITIGFGSVNSQTCGGTTKARDALAAAASDQSAGVPSKANSDCSTTEERAAENNDKDWYFCAATSSDLKSIFAAAIGKVNGNTKFLKVPGVSD